MIADKGIWPLRRHGNRFSCAVVKRFPAGTIANIVNVDSIEPCRIGRHIAEAITTRTTFPAVRLNIVVCIDAEISVVAQFIELSKNIIRRCRTRQDLNYALQVPSATTLLDGMR